ncbi:MAG: tetratricopeptide repeat protein [Brevinematia bacterium]
MDFNEAIYNVWDWIKKNYLYVVVSIGVVFIVLIGIFIYVSIERSKENGLKSKFDIAYFPYINSSSDDATKQKRFEEFVSTLQEISSTGKNYNIVAIANIILGDIYYNNEGRSYDTALSYYSKATNAPSEFLRVIAIFDVAQTYEEMGLIDSALKNYEYIFNQYNNSFLAPMAMFSASKLYYTSGNVEKAKELLSQISNKYPDSYVNNLNNLMDLIINLR